MNIELLPIPDVEPPPFSCGLCDFVLPRGSMTEKGWWVRIVNHDNEEHR